MLKHRDASPQSKLYARQSASDLVRRRLLDKDDNIRQHWDQRPRTRLAAKAIQWSPATIDPRFDLLDHARGRTVVKPLCFRSQKIEFSGTSLRKVRRVSRHENLTASPSISCEFFGEISHQIWIELVLRLFDAKQADGPSDRGAELGTRTF